MTFKEFLLSQKARHDEKGDFLRLANADVHVPDAGTWGEFYSYFEARHGGRIANTGAVLSKEYQASERKARLILKSRGSVPHNVVPCRTLS